MDRSYRQGEVAELLGMQRDFYKSVLSGSGRHTWDELLGRMRKYPVLLGEEIALLEESMGTAEGREGHTIHPRKSDLCRAPAMHIHD